METALVVIAIIYIIIVKSKKFKEAFLEAAFESHLPSVLIMFVFALLAVGAQWYVVYHVFAYFGLVLTFWELAMIYVTFRLLTPNIHVE